MGPSRIVLKTAKRLTFPGNRVPWDEIWQNPVVTRLVLRRSTCRQVRRPVGQQHDVRLGGTISCGAFCPCGCCPCHRRNLLRGTMKPQGRFGKPRFSGPNSPGARRRRPILRLCVSPSSNVVSTTMRTSMVGPASLQKPYPDTASTKFCPLPRLFKPSLPCHTRR